MKNSKKNIYFFEFLLLIFIIMFKTSMFNNRLINANFISLIFFILFTLLLFICFGFMKDKNYLKNISIKISVISLLIYFLITYLMGFFTGFVKSVSYGGIFQTFLLIAQIFLLYVSMELSRYIILKKNPSKVQIVILVLEYMFLNILIEINGVYLGDFKSIFVVTSTTILPIIAQELLYTYITYNISYIPGLIIRLVSSIFVYIVPFQPALGNYLISITELLLPFSIFLQINKSIKYREKYSSYGKKTLGMILTTIAIAFVVTLTALVSGLFKYHMIAIVSNSMNPTYYRGDAVIITKKKAENVNVGEVLAFKHGNGIVTHRVVSKKEKDGVYIFNTKGDNNDSKDSFDIYSSDVIGTVDYILKYAGYPTVWVNEIFDKN